jgi:amidase
MLWCGAMSGAVCGAMWEGSLSSCSRAARHAAWPSGRPASRLRGAGGAQPARPVVGARAASGPQARRPVRVALVVDPAGEGTADQVQQGVRKAANALEDAGYAVEEIEPPSIVAAVTALLDMLNTPETRAGWQYVAPSMPADTQRFMSEFYEVAGDPDPVATVQSFAVRQSLLRVWGEFQQQHPLIVAPIFTDLPFEVGTDLADGRVAQTIRAMRMTFAVNALGLPAVALPVGIGEGLPQSVQLFGPRYREDLCLDAAAALAGRVGIITPIDPR